MSETQEAPQVNQLVEAEPAKRTLQQLQGLEVQVGGTTYTFNSKNIRYLQFLTIKNLRTLGVEFDSEGNPLPSATEQLLQNMTNQRVELIKALFKINQEHLELATIEEGEALEAIVEESGFFDRAVKG